MNTIQICALAGSLALIGLETIVIIFAKNHWIDYSQKMKQSVIGFCALFALPIAALITILFTR